MKRSSIRTSRKPAKLRLVKLAPVKSIPSRPASKTAANRGEASPQNKIELVISLLRRLDGASTAQLCTATGWQAHSVRGAISGTLKKKLGLKIVSTKVDGTRTYRIAK